MKKRVDELSKCLLMRAVSFVPISPGPPPEQVEIKLESFRKFVHWRETGRRFCEMPLESYSSGCEGQNPSLIFSAGVEVNAK
jgi:hypothetical protein